MNSNMSILLMLLLGFYATKVFGSEILLHGFHIDGTSMSEMLDCTVHAVPGM